MMMDVDASLLYADVLQTARLAPDCWRRTARGQLCTPACSY